MFTIGIFTNQYSFLYEARLSCCCFISRGISHQSNRRALVLPGYLRNALPTAWTTVPLNLIGLQRNKVSVGGISTPRPNLSIVQTIVNHSSFFIALSIKARLSLSLTVESQPLSTTRLVIIDQSSRGSDRIL